MIRIEADLLIPGQGTPVRDGVVILDGTRIDYAGPASVAPSTPGAVVHRATTVLPGLWDCHTHLLGTRSANLERVPLEPTELRAARCVRDLRAALSAGFTSVREVGGLGVFLSRAVAEGSVSGPTVYAAGAILSTTGGHGDLHAFPLDWVESFTEGTSMMRLCDGVASCMRAVREQLRRGASLIKVCASGGVLSEVDDPVHQQFTLTELRAIVEVAGLASRSVAAHCHGKPGIMAALEAGVRTIEHGTYLDDECCDAMRETGAILVPTRTIISELLSSDTDMPEYARVKLSGIAATHAEAIALAYSHGVTIACGTDIAASGADLPNSWGRNGRELALLVSCGLTPLDALAAATANGPLTLGAMAPRSGRLEAGFDADVLCVAGDPVADISVLSSPANVTAVWKAGRQVVGASAALPDPAPLDRSAPGQAACPGRTAPRVGGMRPAGQHAPGRTACPLPGGMPPARRHPR
jgi:imidazolonepropionase-like amidohydrolase